jgi:hypothetical protein
MFGLVKYPESKEDFERLSTNWYTSSTDYRRGGTDCGGGGEVVLA